MTGKQLKNSILQWAIQGKLVPQDPNDEPASVLLERIREEKARLVKEKKIKKDKNESIIYRDDDNSYYEKFADGTVKCIDEEIPFEIPKGWEWCRLSNVFETSSGTTPQSKNPSYYSNGTINWVRTTDLNNGILSSCEVKITPKAATDYNLSVIPQNSICIAMYGGGGTIGKHSIIRFDTTINQSVCAIHPNEMCNMEYIHIFMQYKRPYWMDYAAGSRKDPNINQIIIKKCLIPLPPKKEQDKVVEKYNSLIPFLDYYSTAHQQRQKLSEEIIPLLKKAILQDAIQGRLVPQDASEEPASVLLQRIKEKKLRFVKEGKLKKKDVIDSTIFRGDDNKYYEKVGTKVVCIEEEIPFEIPDTWVWVRGKTIFLPMESIKPNGESFTYIDVDAVNNTRNVIDKAKILPVPKAPSRATRKVHTGDVLFSMVRPYLRNIALVEEKFSNAIASTGFYVLTPTCALYSSYLFYMMLSPYVIDGVNQYMKGENSPSINNGHIENYIYPLPPLKEQVRIVKKIEILFDRIKG